MRTHLDNNQRQSHGDKRPQQFIAKVMLCAMEYVAIPPASLSTLAVTRPGTQSLPEITKIGAGLDAA